MIKRREKIENSITDANEKERICGFLEGKSCSEQSKKENNNLEVFVCVAEVGEDNNEKYLYYANNKIN